MNQTDMFEQFIDGDKGFGDCNGGAEVIIALISGKQLTSENA